MENIRLVKDNPEEESQELDGDFQEPIGDPPPTLDEVAKLKWKQLALTLTHLTSKDRAILEQFCSAYVLRKAAEKKSGELLLQNFKPSELNAVNSVYKNATETCQKCLQDMLATPSSRDKKKSREGDDGGQKRRKLPDKYQEFF